MSEMEHKWHESHTEPLNKRAYGHLYPDGHQNWGFPPEVVDRWPPKGVIEQWWYLDWPPKNCEGKFIPDTARIQGRLYNAENPLGTGIDTSKWVKMGSNYVITRNSVYLLGEPHPMMLDEIRRHDSIRFTNELDHWLNAFFESTGEEPAALVEAKEVITKYARANPLGMWHHLRGVNEDADSVVSVNLVGRWDHMDPDGYWMNGTKKRAERGW